MHSYLADREAARRAADYLALQVDSAIADLLKTGSRDAGYAQAQDHAWNDAVDRLARRVPRQLLANEEHDAVPTICCDERASSASERRSPHHRSTSAAAAVRTGSGGKPSRACSKVARAPRSSAGSCSQGSLCSMPIRPRPRPDSRTRSSTRPTDAAWDQALEAAIAEALVIEFADRVVRRGEGGDATWAIGFRDGWADGWIDALAAMRHASIDAGLGPDSIELRVLNDEPRRTSGPP